jgi:hypothetical protein
MKKIGLLAVGFILAIGLLVGAPGTAKAVSIAAMESIMDGASITSTGPNTVTAIARSGALWTVEGYDAAGNALGYVQINSGQLAFNNLTNTVVFTGSVVSGPPTFTVTGTINNYSGPGPTQQYYSWNVVFSSLSVFDNSPVFTYSGAYGGGIGIYQTTGSPITGKSSVGYDVSSVPVPPSLLLLAPGLLGLIGMRKRFKG